MLFRTNLLRCRLTVSIVRSKPVSQIISQDKIVSVVAYLTAIIEERGMWRALAQRLLSQISKTNESQIK